MEKGKYAEQIKRLDFQASHSCLFSLFFFSFLLFFFFFLEALSCLRLTVHDRGLLYAPDMGN